MPNPSIPSIAFLTLSATFKVKSPLRLPAFQGSTWRGALGWPLREVCCHSAKLKCEDCSSQSRCLHTHFFGNFQHKDNTDGQRTPPRPFVIHVNWEDQYKYYHPGDLIGFSITLFSPLAMEKIPELISSLHLLGQRGVGAHRIPLTLIQVNTLSPFGEVTDVVYENKRMFSIPGAWEFPCNLPDSPGSSCEVDLHFTTPLIMKRNGYHQNKGPTFTDLIYALDRKKWDILNHFSRNEASTNSGPHEPAEVILELSEEVLNKGDQTFWRSLNRYSNRKKEKESLSGLMGNVRFSGVPESLIPFLLFGLVTHIGNKTSMGLGAYRLFVNDSYWDPPYWRVPQ